MPPEEPSPDSPSEGRDKRPLVLVAEDDEDIRSVFEMVLAERYDVKCAATGAEALAIAAVSRPAVVLLDWTLPDASGGDVAAGLRAIRPDFAKLPIVIVSGTSTVKTLAARIGAVPCPKPCDVNQLMSAIERALDPARQP
ncbi:MAG TPA: response regulator [Polyangiaceae bacterium]|nr:response regulator [Polyangiaceae bacterium]